MVIAMPVSDKQAATLCAQLAGDLEQHKRLLGELDSHAGGHAYVTLTNAAFFEGVGSMFGAAGTADDVIAFVAEVRTLVSLAGLPHPQSRPAPPAARSSAKSRRDAA